MLPRLDPQALISPLYQQFADLLPKNNYRGEISCQYGARLAVATDNSIYQQLPQLVLHPKSIADISVITKLASEQKFQEISDEALSQLFRSGDLGLIYAHLASLKNLQSLVNRIPKK